MAYFIIGSVQQEKKAEDKDSRQREVTIDVGQFGIHETECILGGHVLTDYISKKIEAPTTRSSRALPIVESSKKGRVAADYHGLARHVDTQDQCASGDDDGQKSATEENLNRLAVESIHAGVMNSYAATESMDQLLGGFNTLHVLDRSF
jgi:hypothetical protein